MVTAAGSEALLPAIECSVLVGLPADVGSYFYLRARGRERAETPA